MTRANDDLMKQLRDEERRMTEDDERVRLMHYHDNNTIEEIRAGKRNLDGVTAEEVAEATRFQRARAEEQGRRHAIAVEKCNVSCHCRFCVTYRMVRNTQVAEQ